MMTTMVEEECRGEAWLATMMTTTTAPPAATGKSMTMAATARAPAASPAKAFDQIHHNIISRATPDAQPAHSGALIQPLIPSQTMFLF